MDTPPRNLDMVRKLLLPFPLLSDPRGELIRRLGLWNSEEKVAVPSIVVVDGSGVVRYIYAGEDFADRPGDEDIFAALDKLEAGRPTAEEPEVRVGGSDIESVGPEKPAQTLDTLIPYYRGVNFTTIALQKRFDARGNKEASREASEYRAMIHTFRDALHETINLHEEA